MTKGGGCAAECRGVTARSTPHPPHFRSRPPPATGPPSAQPLEGPMLAAYLQLAGAMILAGATVAAAKPVVAVLPVYVFGALRFAIAAAVLVPIDRKSTRLNSSH